MVTNHCSSSSSFCPGLALQCDAEQRYETCERLSSCGTNMLWCGVQDVEAGGGAASEEELSDSEEEFHSQVCFSSSVVNSTQTHLCTSLACLAQMARLF